jgi:putative FmdB family regulatory protein
MPLYEYNCEACGATFELIRKFSDPPADSCPKCGQGPVRKLVSSPAFHLKGSGWYATDYAKKSGEPAASKAGDSTSEKPASGSKDTDAKPAADKPAAPAATKDS